MTFTDPDLAELDRIWPLGEKLAVPEDGTIIVAGAYEGRYMRYFKERFPTANVVGFEPQKREISGYGLATNTRYMRLGSFGTDGATVATFDVNSHRVVMKDAVEAIHELNAVVDLAVFNMEGSEWAVLPYLLDEMMHHRIVSMAIQFHSKYVSEGRASRVLSYIDEYYDRKYWDYPTWTYWLRR